MNLLLSGLWPALVLALILGALAGWLSGMPRDRIGVTVAGSLAFLLVGLAGLAISGQVPGAYGLWVETASLMLACYLGGCFAGALGRTVQFRKA